MATSSAIPWSNAFVSSGADEGRRRKEVDLEEPVDINAVVTTAENTKHNHRTITEQSGTNGKDCTISFIESA